MKLASAPERIASRVFVESYPESFLVWALAAHAPPFPGSEALAGTEAWRSFAQECALCGTGPWCLGAISATAVAIRSFNCRGVVSPARPTAKPLMWCECLMLLMLVAGLAAHLNGLRCLGLLAEELFELEERFVIAGAAATDWHNSVVWAGGNIAELGQKCPDDLRDELSEPMRDLTRSKRQVLRLIQDISAVAHFLRFVRQCVRARAQFAHTLLALPLALVFLVCAVVAGSSVCVSRGDGRRREWCAGFFLRLSGVVVVAPAILCAALAGGALLGADVAASSFCQAPDQNSIACMEPVVDDVTFRMSSFYIKEHGTSRLARRGAHARASFESALLRTSDLHHRIRRRCRESWRVVLLERRLLDMDRALHEVLAPLGPEAVRAQYRAAVHDLVCGRVVLALALLALWHTAAGVVCLPALTLTAERFVERRADDWRDGTFVDVQMTTFRTSV